MRIPKTYSIALLGGSFDPPHIGHLKISKQALKILPIKKLYWVVTKKNPFKNRPFYNLKNRIRKCVKIDELIFQNHSLLKMIIYINYYYILIQ